MRYETRAMIRRAVRSMDSRERNYLIEDIAYALETSRPRKDDREVLATMLKEAFQQEKRGIK